MSIVKKLLGVMFMLYFSFIFICPAYGFWPFSNSDNQSKECEKAKKNFSDVSVQFIEMLEQEHKALEGQEPFAGNITEIRKNCIFLEKAVYVWRNTVSIVCGKYNCGGNGEHIERSGENDIGTIIGDRL
jgi:hypothetical protein